MQVMHARTPSRLALVALAASACAAASAARAAEARPAGRPTLVVLLVVDQLGRSRLGAPLPGGLGRLLREGRVFADATLAHGITETCPGHAAVSTGLQPGRAGVPGNVVFSDGRPAYCAVGGSAALLRAATLADWIRAAGGRAIAISEKDRAAAMLGGRTPDLAIWLDPAAGFTTARRDGLPPWLARFDAARGLAPFDPARWPERWSHRSDDPRALPDDTPSESPRWSRTSPHPIRAATLADTVEAALRTPYADALTLDLARAAVESERLGSRRTTDLLALSLSSTDYVGHAYGPDSQEAAAALRELDVRWGSLLAFLEARLSRDRLLVVLTADHGVTPVPEVAEALGISECRVPGGRIAGKPLADRIAALARVACALPGAPEVGWDGNSAFALTRETWSACRVPRPQALTAVAAGIAAERGVVKAWTAVDLEASPCAGACALYRASFDPERSGDWVVQVDPHCLLGEGAAGAGHGSPYAYDRAVPLVFWGNGIAPAWVRGLARTIDAAPTIAARAGLSPGPVDGRPLRLR
jgi:arylsulfatase A-like enzyme